MNRENLHFHTIKVEGAIAEKQSQQGIKVMRTRCLADIASTNEERDPFRLLAFKTSAFMYQPKDIESVGFIGYSIPIGAEFQIEGEESPVISTELLKMHLLNPNPVESRSPEERARSKIVNMKGVPVRDDMSRDEKNMVDIVEEALAQRLAVLDSISVLEWKDKILKDLEKPDMFKGGGKILCVYPSKSVFLTKLLRVLGAKKVEGLKIGNEVVHIENLVGTAVMILSPEDIEIEKVLTFVAKERERLERQRNKVESKRVGIDQTCVDIVDYLPVFPKLVKLIELF